MRNVSIAEFGYLLLAKNEPDLKNNKGQVGDVYLDKSTFDELRETLGGDSEDDNQQLIRFASRKINGYDAIQVRNHVGVLATRTGTQIEILPKTARMNNDVTQLRKTLWKMLSTVYDAEFRSHANAELANANEPLLECFIKVFLDKVNHLVKRGLRSNYVPREENLTFLKGRLLTGANLRHNLVHKHRFYVSYDEFLVDRPENRLIHAALLQAERFTRQLDNRRHCRELRSAFAEVSPTSPRGYRNDLQLWRLDRGAAHYEGLEDWCRMLLEQKSPQPSQGDFTTTSFLFNSNSLFERYVAIKLQDALQSYSGEMESLKRGALLETQAPINDNKALIVGDGPMRADMMLKSCEGTPLAILDTKWKLLEIGAKSNPADRYQMYAYGRFATAKLKGQDHFDLALVVPKTENNSEPNKILNYQDDLSPTLRFCVLPYDLEKDEIILPKSGATETTALFELLRHFNACGNAN